MSDTDQADPSIEQRAQEMGWVPKDQFRGDPAKWADAATYVQRGEHLLPILRANNRSLTSQIGTLQQQLNQANQTIQASQEAIQELKAFNTQVALDRTKSQKSSLIAQIAEAKRAGDVEREVQLTDQLSQANQAITEAERAPAAPTPPRAQPTSPPNPNADPIFVGWRQENPWYGSDLRKTALAGAIATEMRNNPQTAGLQQREFLDRVAQEVEKTFGGNQRRNGASRVEGGNPQGQGGGSATGGRSYADLPADARAACDRQAKRLVGEGRAFKSEKEWRDHYVSQYDWS